MSSKNGTVGPSGKVIGRERSGGPLGRWADKKLTEAQKGMERVTAERSPETKAAHAASLAADKEGTSAAHQAAADAHEKAAAAEDERGNTSLASMHERQQIHHQTQANNLGRAAADKGKGGGGDDRPRDDHGRFASK
jgi:hypothetical protein